MSQQVTVFGANGKVGRLVVSELLARGYSVVAFVHRASSLPDDRHLKLVRGDIYNQDDVDTAVAGSDMVISALGSWGTPKKDILTVGARHIISSMERQGVSRIVTLTGAEARAPGDSLSLIHHLSHFGLGIVARKILVDGEHHITLLNQSSLDWTTVRSPIMRTDLSADYTLTLRRPLPWQLVSRSAVAHALVDVLALDQWRREAPYIR
jgi:putative NADH-flavin reductase